MNSDERFMITSNEYADLLIEYNNNLDLLTNYPDSSYNIINLKYAVLHIPVENITPDSISRYGYSAMPTCYGLSNSQIREATCYTQINLEPNNSLTGKGVLMGIVDTGIDYTNQTFRNVGNTSRILYIWDQSIDSDNYPDNLYYGTEYTQEKINQALNSGNPFSIVPSIDEIGHGTMMAGVAAGSGIQEFGFIGMAPDTEYVIVKLKQAKTYLTDFFAIPSDVACYQENDIMFGVKYLVEVARKLGRPIVICIGAETNQGDHSGLGILSSYLSDFHSETGMAIAISAGNERNRNHHYYNELMPQTEYDVAGLTVSPNEQGFSLEIWGIAPSKLSVNLFAPGGKFVARIPPMFNDTMQLFYDNTTIWVDRQAKEKLSNNDLIVFRFFNPIPGTWYLMFYSNDNLITKYHMWLPINGFILDGTFFTIADDYSTITSPGNASRPTTSTAYNVFDETLYFYAGRGFSTLYSPKPDIASPGVDVITPTTGNAFVLASGCSIATAYTAGVIALLLEWGIVRGHDMLMNNDRIKGILINTARRQPEVAYPNPDWGYGILDLENIYEYLTNYYITTFCMK